MYYTDDLTASQNLFQSVTMTNTGGSVYSATIPAFPLDTIVRYYLEATDDSANVTVSPSNGEYYYTVRPNGTTIMDVQFGIRSSFC